MVDDRQSDSKFLVVMKDFGIFLLGTARAITKLAICLSTLGLYVQMPGRIPAWMVVVIVVGVYVIDLFKSVHIKFGAYELDLGQSKQPTEETKDGDHQEITSKTE